MYYGYNTKGHTDHWDLTIGSKRNYQIYYPDKPSNPPAARFLTLTIQALHATTKNNSARDIYFSISYKTTDLPSNYHSFLLNT